MKKLKKYLVIFILILFSFLTVKKIYGFFTVSTDVKINTFTLNRKTTYTVIHELMNTDGTTYTEHSRLEFADVLIGTSVTPALLPPLEGFTPPSRETVVLNSYANTVITYRYTRNQYTLTVNDSNLVTGTPSGTYYYDELIHLVAAETNTSGGRFVKWSDETTDRDYTFNLTDNVTIGPIYTEGHIITYEPNNGEDPITTTLEENHPLGTLPTVTYNDCVGETGSYADRQCTYYNKFEGWYKEPTFVNKVDETFVPTSDITLYAKWNKLYYANYDTFTCSGSNYIDTGIFMFNKENVEKDFIVKFTVEENNGFTPGSDIKFGTIFTDMNETGDPFPGLHFYSTDNDHYTMNINNTTGIRVKDEHTGYVTGQEVVIKKHRGKVYYSYDGGPDIEVNDFRELNINYQRSASFCAGRNANGVWYRFFKGDISNMSIELIEPAYYTLRFYGNGGVGAMLDQKVKLGYNETINSNEFINYDGSFRGWNTEPDGSGTSFADNDTITSDLGVEGAIVKLYAQWGPPYHYQIHFDANGGTGTMDNQELNVPGRPTPLTANEFTKSGYEFKGWNTEPDGTGTHYDDEEKVENLCSNDGDVITLYAEWWKIQYSHPGDAVFDGTSNTFIDTGINVFSDENINKDFEIRFTFKSVDSDIFTYTPKQPTIFNVKDESNQYMPGFNIRFNSTNSTAQMTPTYKWKGNTSSSINMTAVQTSKAPIEFIYRRRNGVLTMEYIDKNNNHVGPTQMFKQSSWTLNQPFATNVAFGGYFDSDNNPGRFFKGTLSDIVILMED